MSGVDRRTAIGLFAGIPLGYSASLILPTGAEPITTLSPSSLVSCDTAQLAQSIADKDVEIAQLQTDLARLRGDSEAEMLWQQRASDAETVANSLQSDLQAVQGELNRLQSDFTTLQTDVESKQRENMSLADQVTSLTQENLGLRSNLEGATRRVEALGGLVVLYESLDQSADIGNVDGLITNADSLTSNVGIARELLDRIEIQIPLLEAARLTLYNRVVRLDNLYQSTYQLLQLITGQQSGTIRQVVQLVGEWLTRIIDFIPGQLGSNTRRLIDSIGIILESVSGFVGDSSPFDALDEWLGDVRQPNIPLMDNIVNPLRSGLPNAADGVASRLVEAHVELTNRQSTIQSKRSQIDQYKRSNNL